MAFSPQFLDELRTRSGLAQVIGRRVRLSRKGREHIGLCPFHKEKTPSFTVNEDKGFYHCFGCGAHGSAIDFVMNTEGMSFPEAVERLAGEAGMEVPADTPEERRRARQRQSLYDVMEAACAYFEKTLRMPEGRQGLAYFRGRGLDDETIARFHLGFAVGARAAIKGALARDGVTEDLLVAAGLLIRPDDDARPAYDRFRGRVMFPIADKRGRIIAFGGRILGAGEPKYLNSPETPLFQKGRVLYGLAQAAPAARKEGTLIVAEGYMDVIALVRAGFENAVAPLGTALTEDQIRELWRLAREPVLCFDGDAAGERAAFRAAERSLPLLKPGYSLRFAFLQSGEDPDSQIKRYRREFMTGALDHALSLSDLLWRMETWSRPRNTPEQRAALKKRLGDHARTINDPTVRSQFLQGFNDRLWRDPRPAGREGGRGSAPTVQLDPKAGLGVRVDPLREQQQVLLAIIINHPGFIDRVEDQLGAVGFGDESLDGLRQAVLSILSGGADVDADGLREELTRRGLSESLDALFGHVLVRRHRLIRPEASLEDVQATWDESYALLRRAALTAEMKKRKEAAAGGYMKKDEWDQDRSLIRAALEELGE